MENLQRQQDIDYEAQFALRSNEVIVRKQLLLNETIEFKEIELRKKLEVTEINVRKSKLWAAHAFLLAQHRMDHLVVDEHSERKYVTSILYPLSMIEWKAFFEKHHYQTMLKTKLNDMKMKLFNQWVDEYLLRRKIAPAEDDEREGQIEPDEEEARRQIYSSFGKGKTAVERLIVEKEESRARQQHLTVAEDDAFQNQILKVEISERTALNIHLFNQWSTVLFKEEAENRLAIENESGSGNRAPKPLLITPDFFFEQIHTKLSIGLFRLIRKQHIAAAHQQMLNAIAFNVHGPAVVHTEQRERLFLLAQEENAWQNDLLASCHKPMIESHWRRRAAMDIQRVGRAFLHGRQSLFRREYLDAKRKIILYKRDCRDASVLLIQGMLRQRYSQELIDELRFDYFVKIVSIFMRSKQSEKIVVEREFAVFNTRALLFQRLGRGLFDREEVFELREIKREEALFEKDRKNEAALSIQHAWRAFTLKRDREVRRKVRAEEDRRSKAATKIAKTFKMHLARANYLENRHLLSLQRAAQYLQRVLKAARIRVFLHQMLYARRIQSALRCLQSQKNVREIAIRPTVVRIQCAYRCSVARERSKNEKMRRQLIEEDVQRSKAARIIQSALILNRYLSVRQRKKYMNEETRKAKEIAAVQAQFEANKKRFDTLSDLWRIGRGYLRRKDVYLLQRQRSEAVLLIQRALHAVMSEAILNQKQTVEREKLREALAFKRILTLQRFAWAAISHYFTTMPKINLLEARHQEAFFAAQNFLQPVGRAYLVRKNTLYATLQLRQTAATMIQNNLYRIPHAKQVARTRREAFAAEKQRWAVIEAKWFVGRWLLKMIRKRRVAAKTIQTFYHRNALKMRRNQALRCAREEVFAIQRRELEKEAKLEIDLNVVRVEAEQFRKIRMNFADEKKEILKTATHHHLHTPFALIELDEAQTALITEQEERRRLLIIAEYLKSISGGTNINNATNDSNTSSSSSSASSTSFIFAERQRLRQHYFKDRMARHVIQREATLRNRIQNAEELSMRRALMLYHARRVGFIFETTVLASFRKQEENMRKAIAAVEEQNRTMLQKLIRRDLKPLLEQHYDDCQQLEKKQLEEALKLKAASSIQQAPPQEEEEEEEKKTEMPAIPPRENIFLSSRKNVAITTPTTTEIVSLEDAAKRRPLFDSPIKPHTASPIKKAFLNQIMERRSSSDLNTRQKERKCWLSLVPSFSSSSEMESGAVSELIINSHQHHQRYYQLVIHPFAELQAKLSEIAATSVSISSFTESIESNFAEFMKLFALELPAGSGTSSPSAPHSFSAAAAKERFICEIDEAIDKQRRQKQKRRSSTTAVATAAPFCSVDGDKGGDKEEENGGAVVINDNHDNDHDDDGDGDSDDHITKCHHIDRIVFDFTLQHPDLLVVLQTHPPLPSQEGSEGEEKEGGGDANNSSSSSSSTRDYHHLISLRSAQAILQVNQFFLVNPFIVSPHIIIDVKKKNKNDPTTNGNNKSLKIITNMATTSAHGASSSSSNSLSAAGAAASLYQHHQHPSLLAVDVPLVLTLLSTHLASVCPRAFVDDLVSAATRTATHYQQQQQQHQKNGDGGDDETEEEKGGGEKDSFSRAQQMPAAILSVGGVRRRSSATATRWNHLSSDTNKNNKSRIVERVMMIKKRKHDNGRGGGEQREDDDTIENDGLSGEDILLDYEDDDEEDDDDRQSKANQFFFFANAIELKIVPSSSSTTTLTTTTLQQQQQMFRLPANLASSIAARVKAINALLKMNNNNNNNQNESTTDCLRRGGGDDDVENGNNSDHYNSVFVGISNKSKKATKRGGVIPTTTTTTTANPFAFNASKTPSEYINYPLLRAPNARKSIFNHDDGEEKVNESNHHHGGENVGGGTVSSSKIKLQPLIKPSAYNISSSTATERKGNGGDGTVASSSSFFRLRPHLAANSNNASGAGAASRKK